MKRREFNKGLVMTTLAAVCAPFISFGKSKVAAIKKKWDIVTQLNVRIEPLFNRYVKLKKSREILLVDNRVYNTVHETIGPKYKHVFNLVQFMQVEFQFTNDIEYVENKHRAFIILSKLFDKAVENRLIGFGCLMPCCSLSMVPYEKGINREMLFVYPVGLLSDHAVSSYNKEIGEEIFCMEGELARITVKRNGTTVTRAKDYYLDHFVSLPEDHMKISDSKWHTFATKVRDKRFAVKA